MTLRPRHFCAVLLCLVAGAAAPIGCSSTGEVVFGVTSELAPGAAFTSLEARIVQDGAEVSNETFEGPRLSFPLELDVPDLPEGASVDLELTAMQGATPLLVQRATTTAVADRKILFEVKLDTDCVGVDCDDGQTCKDGACVSAFEDPSSLPDYYPKWAGTSSGGVCEPGGNPEVLLGEGQSDYHDVDDGQVLQVEAGPQGGYHVWVAARLKNLSQSGSLTLIEGHFTDIDYAPPSMTVIFTFDPDEGDYCKVYGLRFRLDDSDHPVEDLLGHTMEITLTITDPEGDTGSSTRAVKLSDDFI